MQNTVVVFGVLALIASASFLVWSASAASELPTPATSVTTPAESSADSRIVAGSEAKAPASIEAGAVVVEVSINGRGPFPLMFDTGAENALTQEAAAALGLRTEGTETALDSGGRQVSIAFTHLETVRLGDAEMTNQRFSVLTLPRYLTDRGNRPPLAGFIGYGLLKRFAVRLNYQDGTLTLKPGSDFHYVGSGIGVPLTLAGKTPAVPSTADGISGMFMVDTGSSGALTLRRAFATDNGLDARHPSAIHIKSLGASGPFEAILTRLDSFGVAESRIDRPATRYASSDTAGFPFTDVDGSIGYEILRQFVTTFDYPHRTLWFERSSAFGTRTGQGSAGFQAITTDGAGFSVTTVVPRTAAAEAGMQVGDVITEIDGQSTKSMSLNEFAGLIRQPVGTIVRLSIVRDGVERPVALTLKDWLP